MKKSINTKLFITVISLITFVILFVLLLNSTILEEYYLLSKRSSLVEIYDTINTNCNSLSDIASTLNQFDTNRNFEIVIRDTTDHTLYSSSRDFMKNSIFINTPRRKTLINKKDLEALFEEDKSYAVLTFSDSKIGSTFIGLIGQLDNDYLICIRTPLESIKESIHISNTFLIFVGLICILISSFATLIISKIFTKPIKELNNIAQSMSNLDFSKNIP